MKLSPRKHLWLNNAYSSSSFRRQSMTEDMLAHPFVLALNREKYTYRFKKNSLKHFILNWELYILVKDDT